MIKVLILDDDLDLLEMVSLVLKKQQFAVTSISDGGRLTETINASEPDVILMDIFLGNHDGRKLCFELKKSAAYQKLPVVLYSAAQTSHAAIEQSLADAFLVKPFNIMQLSSTLRSLVPA